MQIPIQFQSELVDPSAFIAPNATVLGDVTIGEQSSVWFGAVLRGDTEAIRIGQQTNIQDLCVLHADEELPCVVGDRVTVGHSAILHGAVIGDDVLIGMRSVVLNGVQIGAKSVIAASAVVTEGTKIPPGSVVMGMPAKVQRQVNDRDLARIRHGAEHYVNAIRLYREDHPSKHPCE